MMKIRRVLLSILGVGLSVAVTAGAQPWKAPRPASVDDVRLGGMWGAALQRSTTRLGAPPLADPAFILADLSQKIKRRYIEYSGDVSGRWVGVAAFLAPSYPKPFAAFPGILAEIAAYQKADGHFGVEQDSLRFDLERDKAILWGNGRLLIGLVEVYERTGDRKSLETAKKLGDYFLATDAAFNRPENIVRKPGGYYVNFETYYLSCIEGLVALGRVTGDERYLEEGKRIGALAATVKDFEEIHSHGRLCATRGLVDLFGVTGDSRWREAAQRDWDLFVERYRLPTGGVKEVLDKSCNRDEGCSESDWLRLNLSLWRWTGNGRCLDEAERCLKGHFIANQAPNGGGSHRTFHQIDGVPVAFRKQSEEAWWCCSEHWPRAMADVLRYAVTSNEQGLDINLMIDYEGRAAGPGGMWKISQQETGDGLHVALESPATTKATVRIHRPAWGRAGAKIGTAPSLSVSETNDAWLVEGDWNGRQEIVVHLPIGLRSEAAPGDGGVLLRGHDLLVAHGTETNAWLTEALPSVRPVVLWDAAMPVREGRVVVPGSLKADADPKRPEEWKLLELAPLRAAAGKPHAVAWFSFRPREATPEEIAAIVAKLQ